MKDFMEIKLTQGHRAYVSIEDYEYLSQWKWKIHPQGYACRSAGSPRSGYKTILMHRVVNNTPKGMETDHINRDKLDNRRENLRTVTRSENEFNKNIRLGNESGISGVCWDKNRSKWLCRVGKKYIGRHNTLQAAQQAREAYLGNSTANCIADI